MLIVGKRRIFGGQRQTYAPCSTITDVGRGLIPHKSYCKCERAEGPPRLTAVGNLGRESSRRCLDPACTMSLASFLQLAPAGTERPEGATSKLHADPHRHTFDGHQKPATEACDLFGFSDEKLMEGAEVDGHRRFCEHTESGALW